MAIKNEFLTDFRKGFNFFCFCTIKRGSVYGLFGSLPMARKEIEGRITENRKALWQTLVKFAMLVNHGYV